MVCRLAPSILIAIAAATTAGCRTSSGGSPAKSAESKPLVVSSENTSSTAGGYYISVAADSLSEPVIAFYDRLYGALDSLQRMRATEQGTLDDYLNEMSDSGALQLTHGDNEIECDRDKCQLRLTGRTVGAGSDEAQRAFAKDLTKAMIEAGIKAKTEGVGEQQQRTYLLGDPTGLRITCVERGLGTAARSVCDFALDDGIKYGSASAREDMTRGKIADCVLSPGTTKRAEEARSQAEQGQLVSLSSSSTPGARIVGYMLYTGSTTQARFLNLFLCGDLYYDDYVVEGAAREPLNWLPSDRQVGSSRPNLGEVYRDDVVLNLAPKLVADEDQHVIVEATFKLRPEAAQKDAPPASIDEATGEGSFYIKLNKSWLN